MKHLMNIHTGIIDTEENWRADYESMSLCEWFGFETDECMQAAIDDDCAWDANLIVVIRDDMGWTEKKTQNRRVFNQ